MRIKLTVTYDGTNYCGWQVQPNGTSIQEILEGAIEAVTGETKIKVTGSGRTDAGVHALGQVAHFDTQSSVPPQNFYRALNTKLPDDIKVTKSELASDDFSARRSAKKKTYTYSFYLGKTILPLKERYATHLEYEPSVEKLNKIAQIFVGEHDFKCFNASGGGAKTTVRTIYSIKIEKTDEDMKILVTGNGFLYNMVRTLVGTLLKFEKDKTNLSEIKTMLENGDRALCGKTLPAKGLCLTLVEY